MSKCERRTRDSAIEAWSPAGPAPMMIASYIIIEAKDACLRESKDQTSR